MSLVTCFVSLNFYIDEKLQKIVGKFVIVLIFMILTSFTLLTGVSLISLSSVIFKFARAVGPAVLEFAPEIDIGGRIVAIDIGKMQ